MECDWMKAKKAANRRRNMHKIFIEPYRLISECSIAWSLQLVERGDHYAQLTILHQHSKQLHQFTFLAYNAMFFSFTITQFNGFFASFGWLRVCVCVLCANSSKPNFLRSLYSFVSSYPIQLILFIKSNCVCSVFVHLFLCSFFLQSHCM